MEREQLEVDVLIVGAGPAGLATALRLAQLIERHNQEVDAGTTPGQKLSAEQVCVLEKGREVGAHLLSGAVLDPRGLRELIPDFDNAAAGSSLLACPVREDHVYFLSATKHWKLPITPPFLRNQGNYIVSLNRLGRWLGERVEQAGISVFTGVAGREMLYEDGRVAGVRTDDKGLDRQGRQKSNFQPGYDVRAKVTVLAEGPRGSLTKELVARQQLDRNCNPQVYGVGVKELWEAPQGRIEPGTVIHTAGWPLGADHYGGGWLYALPEGIVSLGLVAGLDYKNPHFDPQEALQLYKTHPLLRGILEGGRMLKYGAKTLPEGGWFSLPKLVTDGALLVGDGAGFLDSQRLKGIHLAIKSGMLAAETIFDALQKGDFSAARMAGFASRVEASWIKQELWRVRNYRQAMEHGLIRGAFHVALQALTGGRGLHRRYPISAGYQNLQKSGVAAGQVSRQVAPDGLLTFDKLTDLYHSGTKHEEDQPCHLLIADIDICNQRCTVEYGNPCQHFCPAAVYEMVEEAGAPRLHLNPSNCVHCKTCDIMDPYQIITWVPPEGGGGPSYDNL